MSFGTKFINGLQGFLAAFQDPGKPQKAALPRGSRAMRMQYDGGININTQPRGGEVIAFDTLRYFADHYDLMRLAIEKRKDQIESLEWNIDAIDKKDPVAKQRAAEIYELFRRPDGIHSFHRWLRAITEDSFVIDAPALYVRRNLLGHVKGFDLVDGATIKANITDEGRTPLPPDPAYQQIIDGVPAVDLTTEELVYFPRNVRPAKLYGFSPVEQVIVTINLALRRQAYQLGYYTEGNIPEAFIACPQDWTTDQISEFQDYWDAIFENNPSAKRKARFVPFGAQPMFPKDNPMKDEFDEWLARIISYTFDLPPTALVKETNRATAETTQNASQNEGQKAYANYLKDIMNLLIHDYIGCDCVEFVWATKESVEPLKQAQIDEIYVSKLHVLAPSEIRSRMGYDPMTDEQKNEFTALSPPSQFDPMMITKVEKTDKGKSITKKDMAAAEKNFSNVLQHFFERIKPKLLNQVQHNYQKAMAAAEKMDAATRKKIIEATLQDLDFDDWATLWGDAAECLDDIAKAGAYEALEQVKVSSEGITKLVDSDASSWAKERAAELVGKKVYGDQIVDNPNPRWAITESTRDYLRGAIGQAVDEGWSPQQLSASIRDDATIWKDRADMISRTELQFAHQNGHLIGWKGSGVVKGKRSLCLHDDNADGTDPCVMNADAGVIGIDDAFPSGDDAPPFHPNCVCTLLPVLDGDMPE